MPASLRVADEKQSSIKGVSKEQANRLIAEYITSDRDSWSSELKKVQGQVLKNINNVVASDLQLKYIANKGATGKQVLESARNPQ
jgi:hypothetical protein